jgi:hypothetical protein
MLIEALCSLATAALLLAAMVVEPTRARCPAGWYVNGVKPTGRFECLRVPGGNPLYDGAGGWPNRAIDYPGSLRGRIYCTGGTHPVVVNYRVVGCQR